MNDYLYKLLGLSRAFKQTKILAPAAVTLPSPDYQTLYERMIGRSEVASTCLGFAFSMDRAFQLQALLHSYIECVENFCSVTILYKATTEPHAKAYEQLIDQMRGSGFRFIRQQSSESFRSDLLSALAESSSESVFFLVDDIVFKNPTNLAHWLEFDLRDYTPSLRLAPGMDYCYTMDQEQRQPDLSLNAKGFYEWEWKNGHLDWAYPLSVDGHLFAKDEITELISSLDFKSPNTLEGALQKFNYLFAARKGVCQPQATLVNLALNRVQEDNANRHGAQHQDGLLELWNSGQRLNFHVLRGMKNRSAHIDIDAPLFSPGKVTPK